jgi:predicted PurR-regulated permease PerM
MTDLGTDGSLSKLAANTDGVRGQSVQGFPPAMQTIFGFDRKIAFVAEVAQQAWLLIVVPILAGFFLNDGRTFAEVLLSLVTARPQRELMEGVLSDLNQMLAHFIRAQLTLAALSLLAYISFMGAMRVPYALVLGTAGGIMEFVPVVGPLVAAVLIVGVALLTSYPHWFVLLLFLGAWRLVQDYVVSPRIMGKSMELHPLAAIFGVLAG